MWVDVYQKQSETPRQIDNARRIEVSPTIEIGDTVLWPDGFSVTQHGNSLHIHAGPDMRIEEISSSTRVVLVTRENIDSKQAGESNYEN